MNLTPGRCPATYQHSARPRLHAVEAARIAGHDIPATDWRCVRQPHHDPADRVTEHLALPLGPTGPSFRFGPDLVEPDPRPHQAPADPSEHLAGVVDQLARRGVGVVRAEPGDTLVLVVPEGNQLMPAEDGAEPVDVATFILRQVQPHLAGVALLVLAGVTGAVVVAGEQPDLTDAATYTGPTKFEHTAEHGLRPARPADMVGGETTALLPCRAGCGMTFPSALYRDRHEGLGGPHSTSVQG